MRYFFTFLGVMIVWRSFSWLRKDRKQTHRRLRQLPDAGTIGIFTVEQGSAELAEGEAIPVPHEGVLGYLRTCDVVVPVDDVATMHLDFSFVDGEGLYIYPRRGCDAAVDGMPLASRRDSRRFPMQHGSTLEIGQAVLRLGVFAGLDVQEARPVIAPEEDPAGEAYMPDMPQPFYPPQSYPPQSAPYPPYDPRSPYAPQGQPSYAPPMNQPWQGGDGDA